jgi:hypothetical protein
LVFVRILPPLSSLLRAYLCCYPFLFKKNPGAS